MQFLKVFKQVYQFIFRFFIKLLRKILSKPFETPNNDLLIHTDWLVTIKAFITLKGVVFYEFLRDLRVGER